MIMPSMYQVRYETAYSSAPMSKPVATEEEALCLLEKAKETILAEWATPDINGLRITRVTFAGTLAEAIRKTGKPMTEIAATLGIPYRTMQDWRAGKRVPNAFTQGAVLEQIGKMT